MDNVCNHRLFSVPSKVEMAEEQRVNDIYKMTKSLNRGTIST